MISPIPIMGPWDFVFLILIIWAIDTLSPPWPTTELALTIPLRTFLHIPLLIGELISFLVAGVILYFGWATYGTFIMPLVNQAFAFVLTPLGIGLTIIMGIVFVAVAWHLNG